MADVVVNFVKDGQEPGPAMKEAFEELETNLETTCLWIGADDVIHNFTIKNKKNVFIVEDFSTAASKHLVGFGNKVFGPLCLLACQEVLPRHSPVYSVAMAGLTVSITCVPNAEGGVTFAVYFEIVCKIMRDLQENICYMSVDFSSDIHEGVTHLESGEVGSKKYIMAARLKKQIVSAEWVRAIWTASRSQLVHGNDPAYLRKYRCPIFKGLFVAASGIESKERTRMADFVVNFVKDGQKPGSAMKEAFEELETNLETTCVWIGADDVIQNFTTKNKKNVFIVEDFSTAAFKHLVGLGNKVFGPLCLLACLKNQEVLPRHSPVYSVAMAGLTVSITCVPNAERRDLQEKICYMSGDFSSDFHEGVTHLVSGEVGSKKYIMAARLKKQIVSPEWVRAIWTASRSQLVHGNDPAYLRKYRCPIFKGLVVAASGIESKERTRLAELIKSEGGTYSPELRLENSTHLIVNMPRGAKYNAAKQWKIHIVKPQWIFDSLDQGYCLEESRYKLSDEEEVKIDDPFNYSTSTPTMAAKKGRPSVLGNVSAISMTTINDTAMTAFNATLSNQTALSNANQSVLNNKNTSRRMSDTLTNNDMEELNSINLSTVSSQNFLDGCKIFLSGFSSSQMEKLRKIINLGGASRFNCINESVSHVVIGHRNEEHVSQIELLSTRPHTVTVKWLIQSLKDNKCANEKQYPALDDTLVDAEEVVAKPVQKERKITKQGSSRPSLQEEESFHAPRASTSGMENVGAAQNEMEDILSQYLPQAKQASSLGSLGESALMQAADLAENQGNVSHSRTSADDKVQEAKPAQEDMETQDPNDFTMDAANDDDKIFVGKTFIIVGFDETQTADLLSFIETLGGKSAGLTSRIIPDYAVVPIMGYPVERTVNEVVTNAFIQMSAERGNIQNVEDNRVYTPLNPLDEAAQPLEGCVVSISGYAGTERDVLVHIAMVLGAHCQDFMVRKARVKKGIEKNTHLVVNGAKGSKFVAARKWDLPAVSKRWLIECAVQSRRLPETDYDIEKEEAESNDIDHVEKNETFAQRGISENRVSLSGQQMPPPSTSKLPRHSTETSDNDHTKQDPSDLKMDVDDTKIVTSKSKQDETIVSSKSDMDTRENVTKEAKFDEEVFITRHETPRRQNETPGRQNETPGRQNETPTRQNETSAHQNETPHVEMETPSVSNTRVKRLIEENRRSLPRGPKAATPKGATPNSSAADGWETPSKFGIGAVFKPKFDFSDALEFVDNMDTPGRTPAASRKKNQRKQSLPLDELMSHHLEIAVKKTAKPVKHDDQHHTPVPASPAPPRTDTPRPLSGVVIAVAKKMIAKQSEYNNIAAKLGADYRWSYDNSCTHYLFQGRQNDVNREFREVRQAKKFIVSPHWLLACEAENRRVEESQYPHTYNPNMALSISTTETPVRPKRSTRVRASRAGTENVPPAAISSNDTVDSDATLSRRSTRLSRSAPKVTSEISKMASNESKSSHVASMKSPELSDEEMAEAFSTTEQQEKQAVHAAYVDDLKTLMAANTRTYAKRRKSRGTNSSFETSNAGGDDSRGGDSMKRHSRPSSRCSSRNEDAEPASKKPRSSRSGPPPATQTQHVEASQFEVGWDDPGSRAHMEMLAGDLAKNSESLSPGPERTHSKSDDPAHESSTDAIDEHMPSLKRVKSVESKSSGPTETPEQPSFAVLMPRDAGKVTKPKPIELIDDEEEEKAHIEAVNAKPTPPKFIVSGMSQEEKDDYGALVERLGGELIDYTQNFSSNATHFVIEKPSRNEKYLGSISSGLWVLHKSYFEACRSAGKFVPEENYEWGSAETLKLLKNPSHEKLARAAKRWRETIAVSKKGAFHGWKAILLTSRVDSFVRLLEAGGATILASKPPYNKEALTNCTHALFDPKLVSQHITEEDLITLINSDALCVKPEYLAEALVELEPRAEVHTLPHVAKLTGIDRKRRVQDDDELPLTPRRKKQRSDQM